MLSCNGDVTLPQLLSLQNGDRLLAKLKDPNGAVTKLLKAQPDDGKAIEELVLRCLGRMPKAEEIAAMKSALAGGDSRDEVFRDFAWALVNSKEFAFNR